LSGNLAPVVFLLLLVLFVVLGAEAAQRFRRM
jgi:hypothetical protein